MNASVDLKQIEIARLKWKLEQSIKTLMSLKLSPEVKVTCDNNCLVVDITGYGSDHLGLDISSKFTIEAQIILLKQNIKHVEENIKDLKDFWLTA